MTNDNKAWLEAGWLFLDGHNYRIVRPQAQQVQYKRDYQNESPYDSSMPSELVDESITWHAGGFKSHPGIQGSSEYGQNTDARWPFRLLPGPAINPITLTDASPSFTSASTPTSIFEAFGYLFVVAGQHIWRIDQSTDTVHHSFDLGGGVSGIMGLVWHNGTTTTAYVTTNQGSNSMWYLTNAAIGTGSEDTWVQTASVDAYRLAVGASRMFKVSDTGSLKNIASGLDPNDESQWGDDVQVGDTQTLPTALLAFDRTVLVGKPEGLFAVGDEGFGIPQIKRMAFSLSNCIGSINWDPYILVPHSRGLYRYYPGEVVDIGLETEWLNESPVRGHVTALAADGNGFWFFIGVGSDTYVCFARARKGQESALGPMVLDTISFLTNKISFAAYMTSSVTPPRLYFGYGNDLAYIKLSDGGGAPDISGSDYRFALSGSRYATPIKFDDFGVKNWYKVEATVHNVDSNRYWDLSYSIDGGTTWHNQDAGGATMRLSAEGRTTYYLPRTATSVELRPKYDFTSNSATNPPQLRDVRWFSVPASKKLAMVSLFLRLEHGIRNGESRDTRTALEQLQALEALIQSPIPVAARGPWSRDEEYFIPRELHVQTVGQGGTAEFVYIVELVLQKRATDSSQQI